MTNEEAKKRLEVWLKCHNCPEDKQCYDKHLKTVCEDYKIVENIPLEESIKVAISALAVPKSTDLISREAVIDLLNQFGYIDKEMERDLSAIPSAVPDREKGDTVSRVAYEQIMWERDVAIQQLKDLGYGLGEKPKENKGEWLNTEEEGKCKCNKCGEICGFKKDKTYGYYVAEDICPNCGADMRGGKE